MTKVADPNVRDGWILVQVGKPDFIHPEESGADHDHFILDVTSLHSHVTFYLEWCDKIKLSNLLLPRKSGTIKSLQLISTIQNSLALTARTVWRFRGFVQGVFRVQGGGGEERTVSWPHMIFRGGLVFKAHRRFYHPTLGSRVVNKKRIECSVTGRHHDSGTQPEMRSVETGPPQTFAVQILN